VLRRPVAGEDGADDHEPLLTAGCGRDRAEPAARRVLRQPQHRCGRLELPQLGGGQRRPRTVGDLVARGVEHADLHADRARVGRAARTHVGERPVQDRLQLRVGGGDQQRADQPARHQRECQEHDERDRRADGGDPEPQRAPQPQPAEDPAENAAHLDLGSRTASSSEDDAR
jgi:hypothetical protein